MTDILVLTHHPRDPEPGVVYRDVYDLPAIDLTAHRGIICSGSCDQVFLATHRDRLDAWLHDGGRLLVNGHPMIPFVSGLPKHRKLEFHGVDDLWLTATGEHPIWAGIDRRDLLFSTGVPGPLTFDELADVGVAGFYSHAYVVGLPADTTVITGIGPGRLPVDLAYPLGAGEVILHLGNDLLGFNRPGTTATNLRDRVFAHLNADRESTQ